MKRIAMLALAAAGGLAGYLYFVRRSRTLQAEQPRRPMTDEMVARAVERRLARILADPRTVHVTVHEGTVALRGSIDREQLDSALRAALRVPGVSSVVNRLETEGPPPSGAAGISEIGL